MHLRKTIHFVKDHWYFAVLLFLASFGYYFVFHSSNTRFKSDHYDLYIPTDSCSLLEVEKQLDPVLKYNWSFNLIDTSLDLKVRKGLYLIPRGASNNEIKKMLFKTPEPSEQAFIGNIRFRYNMTSTLCKKLDVRSRAVRRELSNNTFIQTLDTSFTKDNVYSIFIQDSLWVYRNASAKEVVRSVHRKWVNFWTDERVALANAQNLSPVDAMILASIVQSESQDKEELPIIAGLYLNRLKTEMKLQADPTVVYSWGKALRRVLRKHLNIKSKYNTYRYKGLPPGPVFTPDKRAIDAVLNPAKHDYLFFVANPELDGKHDFSKTYEEHLEKAKSYNTMLNKKRIYK